MRKLVRYVLFFLVTMVGAILYSQWRARPRVVTMTAEAGTVVGIPHTGILTTSQVEVVGGIGGELRVEPEPLPLGVEVVASRALFGLNKKVTGHLLVRIPDDVTGVAEFSFRAHADARRMGTGAGASVTSSVTEVTLEVTPGASDPASPRSWWAPGWIRKRMVPMHGVFLPRFQATNLDLGAFGGTDGKTCVLIMNCFGARTGDGTWWGPAGPPAHIG